MPVGSRARRNASFLELKLVRLGCRVFSERADSKHGRGWYRYVTGLTLSLNFNPRGCDVESTERNCQRYLRKRVADCKHGFESRWGRQVGLVDVFRPRV